MFFAWDITVPANTAESSPKEQILKLTKGIITKVDIFFPAGCHGLVKVRILRNEFQLIPLSKGEWVTGDDAAIPTEGYYEFETIPSKLKFIAHSAGTTYPHTITVRVEIKRRAEIKDPELIQTLKNIEELLTA